MTIAPFERRHFEMAWTDFTPQALAGLKLLGQDYDTIREKFITATSRSLRLTFLTASGLVAGIVVIQERWPGCAEAFAFLTNAAKVFAVGFVRATSRALAEYGKQIGGLRRLDATVAHDFTESQRWLEWLGFAFEGAAEQYGPEGETHYRYARFF